MKDRINNLKLKNIRDLYRGVSEFRRSRDIAGGIAIGYRLDD
jgi:hypothetical protein